MSRGSQLKTGIKDQKNLLGLKKGPPYYLDTALLLFFGTNGLLAFLLWKGGSLSLFTPHYSRCEKDKLGRRSGMGACGGGLLGQGDRAEDKGEGLQAGMQFTIQKRKKIGESQAKHLRY